MAGGALSACCQDAAYLKSGPAPCPWMQTKGPDTCQAKERPFRAMRPRYGACVLGSFMLMRVVHACVLGRGGKHLLRRKHALRYALRTCAAQLALRSSCARAHSHAACESVGQLETHVRAARAWVQGRGYKQLPRRRRTLRYAPRTCAAKVALRSLLVRARRSSASTCRIPEENLHFEDKFEVASYRTSFHRVRLPPGQPARLVRVRGDSWGPP